MKKQKLKIIYGTFSVLAGLAAVVGFGGSRWLHSMAMDDPLRQSFEPTFQWVSLVAWGIMVIWFRCSVIIGIAVGLKSLIYKQSNDQPIV